MVLTRTDLEEIRKLVNEEASNIINETFLNNIAEKIIKSVSEKFSIILKKQEETISNLNGEIQDLKTVNKNLQKKLDRQEQFSRNLNIRIFGVKQELLNSKDQNSEDSNEESMRKTTTVMEVLDIFHNKLNIDIKEEDIKRCHRISAKNADNKRHRPRAILVRFVSESKRMLVLKNKRALKSTNIHIQEDLTKSRLALLDKAIKKYTHKNAWCRNGIIYANVNGQINKIEKENDLL